MMLYILFTIPVILFFPSLLVYFAQDDFWLLSISQAKTLFDFFFFFVPLKEVVWYRPLSSQVFFYFGQLLFGLQPVLYHLVVFLTHLGTIYLLYRLIRQLSKKKTLAFYPAFIYGIHQLHVVSLSWLAAYSFILGPFFLMLILYTYSNKKYFASFVFFLLGILTTEVLVLVPIIITIWQLLTKQKIINTYSVLQYICVLFLLFLRFFIFPTEQNSSLYEITISPNIVSLYKFYLLRLVGIPLFIATMPFILKCFVALLTLALNSFFAVGLINIYKHRFLIPSYVYLFASLSILGMTLFVLFPSHIAPHYLSFSLIGFAVVLGYVLQTLFSISFFNHNFIKAFVLSLLIVMHGIGIAWTYQTHWIFKRAALAKELIQEKKLMHPVGSEEYFSLGANRAKDLFK